MEISSDWPETHCMAQLASNSRGQGLQVCTTALTCFFIGFVLNTIYKEAFKMYDHRILMDYGCLEYWLAHLVPVASICVPDLLNEVEYEPRWRNNHQNNKGYWHED